MEHIGEEKKAALHDGRQIYCDRGTPNERAACETTRPSLW